MLKAEGISKFYPRKAALKGVSVQFPERGMVFVRGVSGSGKSTLMNILTASDYPDEGKVIYNGVEITKENAESYRRSCVSEIYQDFLLLDDMSVKDNIAFAMQAAGGKADEDIIKDILAKVGLLDCAGEKAIKLSGGEKQRVAIARALVKQGAMIFADEPTGNLDSGNAKAVMDILKDISGQRLVVVVSHNEAQSREYADMIIDISDGEIIGNTSIDAPKDIRENSGGWSAKKDGADIRTVFKLVRFNLGSGAAKSILTTIAATVLCIVVIFAMTLVICDIPWGYAFTLDNTRYKNVKFYYYRENYKEADKLIDSGKYNFNFGFQCGRFFKAEYYYFEADRILPTNLNIRELIAFNGKDAFDVDIVYGSFPERANQLMIPRTTAESILDDQIILDGATYDTLEALIGKHINYEYYSKNISFEISGIFDDGLDKKQIYQLEDKASRDYYIQSNNLQGIAVGGKELGDFIIDNYLIMSSSTQLSFYIEDDYIRTVGYNKDAGYAEQYASLADDEAYISGSFAKRHELSVGDSFVLDSSYYKWYERINDDTPYDEDESEKFYKKSTKTLKVKDIVDDSVIYGDLVINSDLYRSLWLPEDISNPQVMIAESLWINARGLSAYKLFRDMSHIDKFPHIINSYRYNIVGSGIVKAYDMAEKFAIIFISLAVISALALAALQCAAVNYQLSGKRKQFNVLRAIGFGKKSVRALMLLQAVITSLIQCAVGIPLAGVICYFYGRGLIPAVSTEVPMPMGWHAALIGFAISISVSLITAAVKCAKLFKKSIVENGKS